MPTPQPLHRTYCKTCQDFTIHTSDYNCKSCSTKFSSYFPSEVDSNLVKQQRERYSKQKQENILGLYGAFIQGNGTQDIFNDPKQKIIECDAGQKEINNRKKEQREEVKRKGQEILDDYNTNYKHLNRNDKCSCGSSKKFKQCHLIYFNKYLKL
jgi:uncharacterized protein YchJ